MNLTTAYCWGCLLVGITSALLGRDDFSVWFAAPIVIAAVDDTSRRHP